MPPADDSENGTAMPHWDIRREGRAWRSGEGLARLELAPEKIEMIGGRLFWSEHQRLTMLGLLLENVGVDKAIRLGNPQVWRDAIAHLGEEHG
jgi:hypothetical protein